MFASFTQFSCSECKRPFDIGDPFLVSATYPARTALQSEAVNAEFLQQQGEVLCQRCAAKRLGADALSRLKGTVFTPTVHNPTVHARPTRHAA